ncbi:Calcium/calmodulin-dependent/calcium-dependent protein kinase [Phytophthora cactorum]|nr:Calcium/calmodulin-dependent/calcium-dependent protein kinase [Phytophthora cactorum]
MLPDCYEVFDTEHALLVCARSLTFGTFCLATLVGTVYAFQRILPIFLSSQWYLTNLSMLALAGAQMALLVYECFITNSPKILVLAKYFRCVQIAISCVLYGKSAGELVNRTKLFYSMLIPIVGLATIAMTADALLVVGAYDEIDCHHITWMAMSVTAVVLTAGFAIPGRVVLEEINSTARKQRKKFQDSSELTELEQSHHQLWILLIRMFLYATHLCEQCNLVSTSLQLAVDTYLSFSVGKKRECDSMFFDDNGGLFEQSTRLAISIGTYLVPNWGVLYVFYVLPRFQFSTALDVPGLLLDDEGDEADYELLPGDERTHSMRHSQNSSPGRKLFIPLMSHDSVRLLRTAPPAKSPLDLSAHDVAMPARAPDVADGGGRRGCREPACQAPHGKKLLFLRKFSVLEEDIVVCNRVRCGVDPSWLQHRNAGDRRYLRALSFEEARLAATRRRRSVSMAAAYSKKSQSMRINTSDLLEDDDAPTTSSGSSSNSTEHSSSNSTTGRATSEDARGKPTHAHGIESSALLTPREKAMHGRYIIRESFAAGAYGKVCSGQDKSSLEEVAVKIVPKYILISPEEKQSVIREQVIHKGLDHPTLQRSLNTIITPAGIEENKCRDLFRQVLLALEYLHGNNIVHHDIKPHNVLLDDGGVTVMPFAGIFGTVGYIAPELLDGKASYGPAIDMFSAGVMLFEMELEFPNRPRHLRGKTAFDSAAREGPK